MGKIWRSTDATLGETLARRVEHYGWRVEVDRWFAGPGSARLRRLQSSA
jgi:hypothetical protein